MPHNRSNRLRPAASALLLLLAGLLLAACGGSSKSTSSTSAPVKGASGPGGQLGARGAALRTCLQKNGITLPARRAGQRAAPGTGGPFGAGAGAAGGANLPKGVTRAQLQAALKKCGGGQFPRGGKGFAADGAQRFAKFAACMRKSGVSLPKPNTSGKGPIFDTKGIDTTSAAFKAVDAECARELAPAGARPGAAGSAGAAGAAGQAGPPSSSPVEAPG